MMSIQGRFDGWSTSNLMVKYGIFEYCSTCLYYPPHVWYNHIAETATTYIFVHLLWLISRWGRTGGDSHYCFTRWVLLATYHSTAQTGIRVGSVILKMILKGNYHNDIMQLLIRTDKTLAIQSIWIFTRLLFVFSKWKCKLLISLSCIIVWMQDGVYTNCHSIADSELKMGGQQSVTYPRLS